MMAMRLPGGVRMMLPGVNSRGCVFFPLGSGLSFICRAQSRFGPATLAPASRLQKGGPLGSLLAAKFVQVIPAEQAGVMAIIEPDANGIVADRFERLDLDALLSGDDLLSVRAVSLHFGAW